MAEAIRSFTLTNLHVSSSFLTKEKKTSGRGGVSEVRAMAEWPLMAVMVQQIEGMGDIVTDKHVWHLSDQAIKNVYLFYIMFTCWGCLFFGATKDPYYDSEAYRGDGGDEMQDNIEESARAELWREELIEEIEQKVGGLRETVKK